MVTERKISRLGLLGYKSMARTRRCNIANIPEELIFDILIRLPVESLVRCKYVCKLWQFIISSTRFVQTHLANSHKKQPVLLNYWYERCRPEKYIQVHDTHHQDFVKLDLPPQFSDRAFINSCDGLVCLSNYDSSVIHIWNPATRRLKLLPTPEKQLSRQYVHIGLGFDSICNDYKILRIAFRDEEEDPCTAESEVYSANADSWKQIEIPKRLQQLYLTNTSKLVPAKSGILYMAIEPQLMAFDLHNEVFRLYAFPDFEHSVRSNVLEFEGSVAMIFQDSNGSGLSLYRLDDVCEKGCWIKMFNLEADINKINWVVGYLGCGQFIARNYVEHCVFYYDYRKGETKKCLLEIPLDGMSDPVKYTKSLVWLDGFEQVVNE